MLKKVVCGIMAVVLFCSGFSVNAHATSNATDQGGGIVCYAAYTRNTAQSVAFSSQKATVKCSLTGYTTTTKVKITAYLQKKSGTTWSNVANWSQTFAASSGTLSKTKDVSAGTYRVKVVYTAYSGDKSEELTKYSGEKTC